MEALDFKDIREQIEAIATCVEVSDDFVDIEDEYIPITIEKFEFAGYISVCGKAVYTSGSYINNFEDFSLNDFSAEDEELEEYLENYELNELEIKISA